LSSIVWGTSDEGDRHSAISVEPVDKGETVVEPAKSVRGCTSERLDMKKASGKPDSKTPAVDSGSFADELSESLQLQERLRAIVHDLEVTIHILEQNLQEARSFAHSRHEVKEESARKANPRRTASDTGSRKHNSRIPTSTLPGRAKRTEDRNQ
jgi:hypothetical protein